MAAPSEDTLWANVGKARLDALKNMAQRHHLSQSELVKRLWDDYGWELDQKLAAATAVKSEAAN